ncbi:peptidase M23-like protein [Solirubrobacter pauli]|uniref:Peptidase M23-like protein n=1 Tax=Solirubrobacter pauli TaxID=166793 RepID=A0A660L795_9ACTN|nr:VCBS repeat domain-containing M23 family metallopeptidase [Solirubrobacter pauli]RKQ90928.1 peptidase M23-like protein [Solirubrobacter pauli]
MSNRRRSLQIALAMTVAFAVGFCGQAPAAWGATKLPYPTNGWVNPVTPAAFEDWGFASCSPPYNGNQAHLGADSQGTTAGQTVIAMASGTVVRVVVSNWGPGGAIGIEHVTADGTRFVALYGHIDVTMQPGQAVAAGQAIGTLHDQRANSHLHLGLRPLGPGETGSAITLWGSSTCINGTARSYGFVNPIPWLATHPPATPPDREPDADGDGTPDVRDACPSEVGPRLTSGCPDDDGDGVTDRADICSTIAGSSTLSGCPEELIGGQPRSRVDFDGDGRADFCRLTGGQNNQSSYAQCTLSTGSGFGATITSALTDWGYDSGRAWVDFNGDGKADFCRLTGGQNNQSSYAQCTLSTGNGFGATITSALTDWGYDSGRAWVDFNGDGKADFCRLTGGQNNQSSYAQCTLSTGNAFGATITSALIDWGLDAGRAWTDFDGDGKADFCRLTGGQNNQSSYAQCTLSTGTSFGPTTTSAVLDWGRNLGRAWADLNGDGKADFCRLTGAQNNQSSYAQCTLSTGNAFGATITSALIDWGLDAGRAWTDFDGDGKADFCRLTGAQNNQSSYAQCTLSTGTAFGPTTTSAVLDWGRNLGRAWADLNGDGKADFCRLTGAQNNQNSYAQCTLSTGSAFGATITSALIDWGLDAGRAWPGTGNAVATTCPQPSTGRPPTCDPQSVSCSPSQIGAPPNCQPPAEASCGAGISPTPPDCVAGAAAPPVPSGMAATSRSRNQHVTVRLAQGCAKRYLRVSGTGVSILAIKRMRNARCRITLRIQASARGLRAISVKLPHQTRRTVKKVRVA